MALAAESHVGNAVCFRLQDRHEQGTRYGRYIAKWGCVISIFWHESSTLCRKLSRYRRTVLTGVTSFLGNNEELCLVSGFNMSLWVMTT